MSAAGAAAADPQQAEVTPPAGDVVETETEAPAEGETTVTDPPVEGETHPPAAEIPEETLKAAAEKFAADAVKAATEKAKQANSAMAAARRAEARTEAVKAENKTLTENLTAHQGFVERLQKGDVTALAMIGFPSLRAFLDRCATGDTPAAATPQDEIAALRREREQEKAEAAAQRIEGAKAAVKSAIEAQKDTKYPRAATTRGHREIWEAVEAYNELHGTVPDDAIFAIADRVEASLRKEFGEPSSVKRPTANNGALPGKGTGKTITSRGAASAPGSQELSMDPDIRREQVAARMRAAGEL